MLVDKTSMNDIHEDDVDAAISATATPSKYCVITLKKFGYCPPASNYGQRHFNDFCQPEALNVVYPLFNHFSYDGPSFGSKWMNGSVYDDGSAISCDTAEWRWNTEQHLASKPQLDRLLRRPLSANIITAKNVVSMVGCLVCWLTAAATTTATSDGFDVADYRHIGIIAWGPRNLIKPAT